MTKRSSIARNWRERGPTLQISQNTRGMILKFIVTAVAVSLTVGFLQAQRLTAGLEAHWIDMMGGIFRPDFDQPVVVVAVTQGDFDSPELYGGLSPLDPERLCVLMRRIAIHQPRCVVLDVLIHPAAYEPPARRAGRLALYDVLDSLAAETAIQWVLARSTSDEPAGAELDPEVLRRWMDFTSPRTGSGKNLQWGVPQFVLDQGMVRFAHPRLHGIENSSGNLTLFGAAIGALASDHGSGSSTLLPSQSNEKPEPWLIRFSGRLPTDPNTSGPTGHFARSGVLVRGATEMPVRSILKDRVIVVGGTYRESRDYHWTPLGPMPGVYIWAEAIASRLRGDAPREAPVWLTTILDALLGITAGVALARWSHMKRLLLSIGTLILCSVLFSWLTFGAGFLFINFLPSMLGVLLQYQFEIHLELRALRKELEMLARD